MEQCGALSPGSVLLFEVSGLPELPRTPLESSFLKDHFWTEDGIRVAIPKKPPYRKPQCRRSLPQENDPHTMPLKTL